MKPLTMLFGTEAVTSILDENGSTSTAKITYNNGQPKLPVRRSYNFRERVRSTEEANAKYIEFAQELEDNPHMLDPTWLPKERSKVGDDAGYFYVVKGYTLLEY